MADGNSPNNRIHFFSHGIAFSLKKKRTAIKMILSLIQKEKKNPGTINYIFCSDKFLLGLNKKFLRHATLTDIITFQYPEKKLSGEIYISIQRVKENAKKFKVPFYNELYRVMVHGALHLCGYKDKSRSDKNKMRKKEDLYLHLIRQ